MTIRKFSLFNENTSKNKDVSNVSDVQSTEPYELSKKSKISSFDNINKNIDHKNYVALNTYITKMYHDKLVEIANKNNMSLYTALRAIVEAYINGEFKINNDNSSKNFKSKNIFDGYKKNNARKDMYIQTSISLELFNKLEKNGLTKYKKFREIVEGYLNENIT